jgi:dolichol-phosphate mannosyltransferase
VNAKKISVVLPIYNTGGCLEELYQRLCVTLEKLNLDFELVMIEDGGKDRAWEIVERLAAADRRIKAIQFSRNFGQHAAISAGFANASGDVIVLMDADLEDRPENIPLLLERLRPGIDIVYTVKSGRDETFSVRLTSQLYHYVFSRLTGTNVPRNIGTFRLFTRTFLDALQEFPERNILFGPLMFYIGFRSDSVEVQQDTRKVGVSGYTFFKRLAMAFNSILSYTDLPQRVLMVSGGVILGASFLYIILLILRFLLTREALPPGLTLLALLFTILLGVTMLSFGITGAYIFRIYQEVLRRPRYIVARTANLDRSHTVSNT